MPAYSSYALQFTGFTASTLAATGADLLIVEAGITGVAGQATLTAAELASLRGAGKQVVGYVNTSVTDHMRAYWQTGWVTPAHADEPDVGTITSSAPDWLKNNLGLVDFAPEPAGQPAAAEAVLVNYRDPVWRALVVDQALAVVNAGFHGVFLDDVGRYFEAGYAGGAYDPTLADSMMQLVIEVATAIRAVDPDATVIVNSGINIGGDSSAGTAGTLFADYRAAIDGVLIENQAHTETNPALPGVLSAAVNLFPGVPILPLENRASGLDVESFLDMAGQKGLLPYLSPNEGYGQFAPAVRMGTLGADTFAGTTGRAHLMAGLAGHDRLKGAERADELYGHAGNDSLSGLGGNDLLLGGLGNDVLFGWTGNDSLKGGDGNDRMLGFDQDDRLWGEGGDDTMDGGIGHDSLSGGNGHDSLQGGLGNDVISGWTGMDRVEGGDGDDRALGFSAADRLWGGRGNDTLEGGTSNDSLSGEEGNDVLIGGAGDDMIFGGPGRDRFVFDDAWGLDRVSNFTSVSDTLDLRGLNTDLATVRAGITDTTEGLRITLATTGGSGSIILRGIHDTALLHDGVFLL